MIKIFLCCFLTKLIFLSGLSLIYMNGSSQNIVHANSYLQYVDCEGISLKQRGLLQIVHACSDSNNVKMETKHDTWLGRKLFHEHFLDIDTVEYKLIIDPIVHFSYGREFQKNIHLYENTRGLRLHGNISNQLFFSSELYETQTVYPSYIEAFADSFGVAPGLMRAKTFKDNGRDVATVYGMIAYKPNEHWQFALARDKLHFGHGYRSMVLSNSAPAYNFLSFSHHREKWSYDFVFASLQNVRINNIMDVPQSTMGGYQNKYASFIQLTFTPLPFISFSFLSL
jgi:catechol 2,3-dioxygenase-like lactoylglutathione lyase family enzyme